MKALEKLRRLPFHGTNGFGNCVTASKEEINAISNEIEAEIEREWMRLPVDADGVPIKPDELVLYDGESREVFAVSRDYWVNFDGLTCWPSQTRHVTERTIEDVLFNFWNECGGKREWKELEERVSAYAAELRELMGGDAS